MTARKATGTTAKTVRGEVAKREEQAAEKKQTLAQFGAEMIQHHAAMLDAILPAHVDRRRFLQMTIQAIREAPELAQCFTTKQGQASFLLAAGQAAMVGLEPNTPTQECWILPRKAKDVQEAHLLIGYRGIMKLARRSGTLRSIVAEVVRERDAFDYGYGQDGPWLTWKPAEGDRGELTHAFAISWTKDGGRAQIVLNRTDVEARRAMSDSWKNERARPHSPWSKPAQEPAMWRKSAIRALGPWLDLSAEAETALSRDDRRLTYDPSAGAIEVGGTFGALEAGDDAPAKVDGDGVIEGTAKPAEAKTGKPGLTDSEGREYAPDDPERPM